MKNKPKVVKGLSKREKRIADAALKFTEKEISKGRIHNGRFFYSIIHEEMYEECAKAAKKGGRK